MLKNHPKLQNIQLTVIRLESKMFGFCIPNLCYPDISPVCSISMAEKAKASPILCISCMANSIKCFKGII